MPLEIQEIIIGNLPQSALAALRRTCKNLSALATPHLFKRVWISPFWRDRNKIKYVSEHPDYSKLVKEIAYDATNAVEGSLFNDSEGFDQPLHTDLGLLLPNTTKSSVKRGYRDHRDARAEKRWVVSYDKENFTKLQRGLPRDFKALLEQPDDHHEILRLLAPDLAALVPSMRSMPNLRTLIVSDTRYMTNTSRHRHKLTYEATAHLWVDRTPRTRIPFMKELTYRVDNAKLRGENAVKIDRLTWPDNREEVPQPYRRDHYRGFAVLMQAASMA